MKEEKIGKRVVRLYDNSDEAPIKCYNLFNEYCFLDSEIGSDLPAVDRRFQKLHMFLGAKKVDEALSEASQLHQTFWNIFEHTNFPSLAYGSMIESIDGKILKDYSQESLKKILGDLSDQGLTQGMVRNFIEELKKKLLTN